MTFDNDYLFNNAQTFETFDRLIKEERNPKLAVTKNGRVVIYSQIYQKKFKNRGK